MIGRAGYRWHNFVTIGNTHTPQGSPVSPILFMLYLQPLFKVSPTYLRRGRFGYADDVGQLVASLSLDLNCELLQQTAVLQP